MSWIFASAVLLALFALVVLRGAPYVPTHRRTTEAALDLLSLKPGDVVVDLGSGDGVFLKAAARRGLRAVGYELNPLLCVVAWLRCWQERRLVRIRLQDFWLSNPPPDTKAVFVFLAGPFMSKLARKLQKVMVARQQPLLVVSHGFAIPGLRAVRQGGGLYLYRLRPKA